MARWRQATGGFGLLPPGLERCALRGATTRAPDMVDQRQDTPAVVNLLVADLLAKKELVGRLKETESDPSSAGRKCHIAGRLLDGNVLGRSGTILMTRY